jgi:signal transduction histidine kinase/serine phosphatase RsbU (regulator of sigma subunit)/anti-sigma regulatory factor (Ser/Thr protein kinase)
MPDFRVIFERQPGLFLVLNPALNIIAVSDAYLQATMTKREFVVDRPLFEVFPDNPNDPAASGVRNLRASLERVLKRRTSDTMSLQKYDIRRPIEDGGGFEERIWSPLNYPVFDSSGEILYIIHRAEDVTDFVNLKKQGSEQEKLTEELRARAEQSEIEIYFRSQEVGQANARLEDANTELSRLYEKTKELDELKTQFFANVSHELRTPLALILGPVDKLIGSITDDGMRADLQVIARNAHLLRQRVDDLLDVSKLEAGKMALDYVEYDVGHNVLLLCECFRSLAEEKHIELQVDVPSGLIGQLDAEKLQRIVLNLLSNAFKFTPTGGRIRCKVWTLPSQRTMSIEVADSGPGVSLTNRELIFERFRQSEGGATRHHGGTGLGLAIAREFSILHGGTIVVKDAPEGGAAFVVTLPLTAPAGTAVRKDVGPKLLSESVLGPIAELRKASKYPKSRGKSELPLVLVVEDHPEMNAFICESLSTEFSTESAFDGAEGLQKAKTLLPDLVLTDVMMPGVGGDTLARDLLASPTLSHIPVIVLTAKADEALRVQLLRNGVRDYVTKPFSVEELRARIRNLVNAKLAAQQSERLHKALKETNAKAKTLLEAYERSERISARFQDAALPEALPKVEGFRFDAVYRPGPSDVVLGGDWYDAVCLSDGRIIFSIGDVGGSGLGAAVIMAAVRQVIRGVAYVNPDPVMLLEAAGKTLRTEYPDTYVSAFVGLIDPVAMELTYASAGHPPPLLRRASGTLEELSDDSVILGVAVEGTRVSKHLHLEPGSLLVLYTDGLVESTDDLAAADAKLRQVVGEVQLNDKNLIASAIHDGVLRDEARDDIAILTIEVLESPFAVRSDHTSGEIVTWTFDAGDATTAQQARIEFADLLRAQGAGEEDVYAAEIVFGELSGNVLRHAPGKIQMLFDCSGSAPVLHVLDEGAGFSFAPRLPHDIMAESGRGLYIIAALTDDFNVTRRLERGSHARAVIALSRNRFASLPAMIPDSSLVLA